jgi:hypothetical protein
MSLTENRREPKRTTRFIRAKAGSPTRRETQGDGTPIVAGIFGEGAAHQNEPERAMIQARREGISKEPDERGMRNANHRSVPGTYP